MSEIMTDEMLKAFTLKKVRLHITRREREHEFSYYEDCPTCVAYDMGVSDAEATN